MRKQLSTLTDNELAKYFVSTNESTMTAPRAKYIELTREANRIREYGIAKHGQAQWQHLTNRIYVN